MIKLSRFKKIVDSLSTEWNERDGIVSAEFSTSGNDLRSKLIYLSEAEKNLKPHAIWVIRYCDTCKGYDESKSFHVEIVKC